MCHSESDSVNQIRSCDTFDGDFPVNAAVQMNTTEQFLEEVNNAAAQLLDNVIRDVITSEDIVTDESNAPLSNIPDPALLMPQQPHSNHEPLHTNLELTQEANLFVENLIDHVSEPIETAELQQAAENFLEHVIKELSSSPEQLTPDANHETCTDSVEETNLCHTRNNPQKSNNGDVSSANSCHQTKIETLNENADSVGSDHVVHKSMNNVAFFVPTDSSPKCKNGAIKKKKESNNFFISNRVELFSSTQFDELVDGFVGKLINETLSLFNPLFQFYRASGSFDEITIKCNPIQMSEVAPNVIFETVATNSSVGFNSIILDGQNDRPIIDVIVERNPQPILERKVFDLKRWACISRPQYKFSCGISSLVSCFNFLFTTLGNGDLPPVTQESAMSILGFQSPFDQIRFGPFTGNVTLKKWFKRLTAHYNVRGYYYTLYKPKGQNKTSISAEDALDLLKEGIESDDTAFIYHCFNHYMCPIGYEVTPSFPELAYASYQDCTKLEAFPPKTWIIFGDTSQKHPSLHTVGWEDVVLDLNCEQPFTYNIRKLHLGVSSASKKHQNRLNNSEFSPSTPKSAENSVCRTGSGRNIHCIMAIKKLSSQMSKNGVKKTSYVKVHHSTTSEEHESTTSNIES